MRAWITLGMLACAACDSASVAQRCDRDGTGADCLEAARGEIAQGKRDLALYHFNRACAAGTKAACHEKAVALAADRAAEAFAVEAFEEACRQGVAASCLEVGRAHRDGRTVAVDLLAARVELDQACRGGEAVACLERDRIPADLPPPAPDVAAAPPASDRPWFYPEGFPLLPGGTVDAHLTQASIRYAAPRAALTDRMLAATGAAGWPSAGTRIGPTGTLLTFHRNARTVTLRLDDAATGTALVVVTDVIVDGPQ